MCNYVSYGEFFLCLTGWKEWVGDEERDGSEATHPGPEILPLFTSHRPAGCGGGHGAGGPPSGTGRGSTIHWGWRVRDGATGAKSAYLDRDGAGGARYGVRG